MFSKTKILFYTILPKKIITIISGWIANRKASYLTKFLIDFFVWFFKVDMSEAQKSNTASYLTFNEFFTRSLKSNVRPIVNNSNILVAPADGVISQIGCIKENRIFQAKGYWYSLESLVACNPNMSSLFNNGKFVTTYISPHNYHWVHMPCDGILREMIYIPGELYSVNQFNTCNVPNLFLRNERVICLFQTPFGAMAQILIGSIIVGSIETIWFGVITPPRDGIIKRWVWPYANNDSLITLNKGQEMGCFRLGSTVINLFMSSKIEFMKNLQSGSVIKLGQPLAISLPVNN